MDQDAFLKFNESLDKMFTMTALHPAEQFGELSLDHDQVTSFEEKPSNIWARSKSLVCDEP